MLNDQETRTLGTFAEENWDEFLEVARRYLAEPEIMALCQKIGTSYEDCACVDDE